MSDTINAADLKPLDTDTINASDLQRVPDAMDYALPTFLSRFIHGSPAAFAPGDMNALGDIFSRPAAAVRGGILSGLAGKSPLDGYVQGSTNPQNVPDFQQLLLQNAAPKTTSTLANFIGGLPASTAGVMADTLSNPSNLLAGFVGQGLSGISALKKIGAFSPDQAIGNAAGGLINKLRANYVSNNIIPRVNQLFGDAVDSFTPSVQQFATSKLRIPQEVVDHLVSRGTKNVEAAANALNNNADTVYQAVKSGFDVKDQAISEAYQKAFSGTGNSYIPIPKAFKATNNFLQTNKIIDKVGNLTEYGKQAIGDDGSLNKVYGNFLLMRSESGAGSTVAQRANIAPVSPTQWTVLRNNFSKARNSTNYTSPITDILSALHNDAEDFGIPVQAPRVMKAQYEQMLPVAQKFVTDSGENKLNGIFKLPQEQVNNLQAVDKYLGTNSVQQARDLVANQALQKIKSVPESAPFKPSLFENLLEKAASAEGSKNLGSTQQEFESLLGKSSNLNSIFNDLKFKSNQAKLQKVLPIAEGGLGILAVKYGFDKIKETLRSNADGR